MSNDAMFVHSVALSNRQSKQELAPIVEDGSGSEGKTNSNEGNEKRTFLAIANKRK